MKIQYPAILLLAMFCVGTTAQVSHALPTVSNREASPEEIGYLPKEGDQCAVNPPALAWLREEGATTYTVEISSSPAFAKPEVSASTKYLLYTHTKPLTPGNYSWRYRYETPDKKVSDWSKVRHFVVPSGAVIFPRPSREMLAKAIPSEHPHAFIRPEGLTGLRESKKRMPAEWTKLKAEADECLSVSLM